MKNNFNIKNWFFAIAILPLLFFGCSKFTDITPKGASVLDRVEDLEMLLNHQGTFAFGQGIFPGSVLINDFLASGDLIRVIIDHEAGFQTAESILFLWDETADRNRVLNLGTTKFDAFYRVIGTVANPILRNIATATGSRERANQIKAEALVLRAYMHYLAVNIYARAYNPATAATDGGVPYMLEGDYHDLTANPPKRTVREVYNFILADLDAALALNALPLNPIPMRVGKAFAHAVRAKALMATRQFDSAYVAATRSLEVNDFLLDHRVGRFRRPEFNREDLFFIRWGGTPSLRFTPEFLASFAPNDAFFRQGDLATNLPHPLNLSIRADVASGVVGAVGWMHLPGQFPGGVGSPMESHTPNTIGLSTVDMFLIQAEVQIRRGNTAQAMAILEMLRERRTMEGQHDPLPSNPIQALQLVSRHEGMASHRNFINIKRWNTEPEWAQTLTRTIELAISGFTPADIMAQTPPMPIQPTRTINLTLRPDSPLWIFPFPQSASNFNPNLTNNF